MEERSDVGWFQKMGVFQSVVDGALAFRVDRRFKFLVAQLKA